jgi:hypothetical protein
MNYSNRARCRSSPTNGTSSPSVLVLCLQRHNCPGWFSSFTLLPCLVLWSCSGLRRGRTVGAGVFAWVLPVSYVLAQPKIGRVDGARYLRRRRTGVGPGGDQMTSRPEHVQRRADPSGGTLISVEVVRHCTPSGLNRGADCSARLYWMGSEAGTQPYGVPRPRLGSGRHVGDSPSGTVPPAPPARPTAARRPNAACIG